MLGEILYLTKTTKLEKIFLFFAYVSECDWLQVSLGVIYLQSVYNMSLLNLYFMRENPRIL